jgi:hypothetical protein
LCQEALPTLFFFAKWVWAQAEKNLDGCWMDFSIAHYPVSHQCQCIFFVSWCWPVYWHNLFQNLQQAHQTITSSISFSLKYVAVLLWSVPTRGWVIVQFLKSFVMSPEHRLERILLKFRCWKPMMQLAFTSKKKHLRDDAHSNEGGWIS